MNQINKQSICITKLYLNGYIKQLSNKTKQISVLKQSIYDKSQAIHTHIHYNNVHKFINISGKSNNYGLIGNYKYIRT